MLRSNNRFGMNQITLVGGHILARKWMNIFCDPSSSIDVYPDDLVPN